MSVVKSLAASDVTDDGLRQRTIHLLETLGQVASLKASARDLVDLGVAPPLVRLLERYDADAEMRHRIAHAINI